MYKFNKIECVLHRFPFFRGYGTIAPAKTRLSIGQTGHLKLELFVSVYCHDIQKFVLWEMHYQLLISGIQAAFQKNSSRGEEE